MQIKVVKEVRLNAFIHGVFFWWAINSLYQDIIGKEAYLQNVQTNWVDGSITIPIAIGVLFFVVVDLFWKALRKS